MNPELDLQYLEDRGFTDLGGDVFTLGVEPKVRLAPRGARAGKGYGQRGWFGPDIEEFEDL